MEGDLNLRAQGTGLEATSLFIYLPNDSWHLWHAKYRGHGEKSQPACGCSSTGEQSKRLDKARSRVMPSGVQSGIDQSGAGVTELRSAEVLNR